MKSVPQGKHQPVLQKMGQTDNIGMDIRNAAPALDVTEVDHLVAY
jgi:hypothetical protein